MSDVVDPRDANSAENASLPSACKHLARQVLWENGAASSDVVETLAEQFHTIAAEHQDFVRSQREDDDVIAHAVQYIADVHALPAYGTDTRWFRCMLDVLIEVAVPNSGLSKGAARLLPCLQEGISGALTDVPITRESVRIEGEDAKTIKMFERAGCEFGCVSDLLDLIECLYHGDRLDAADARLYRVAALSAPLTRQARIDEGIDKP